MYIYMYMYLGIDEISHSLTHSLTSMVFSQNLRILTSNGANFSFVAPSTLE